MTKDEVSKMLLHLKDECNKHPKAKSIKCNKWELLEIADYFLDLVGRIEFLSVSEEFNKEDYLTLSFIYNKIGENLKNVGAYKTLHEVETENMAHKLADNLVKYLDVKLIDDPLNNLFVYKANLCVLKRKDF